MSRAKAFTLVELLIVIAIIAILTVAFLPGALQAPAKARDAGRQKAVRDISAAVEAYIAENNGTIPSADVSNCFISSLVIASNFNPLPIDPKPQTVAANTSCGNAAANAGSSTPGANKYLYMTRPAGVSPTYYVVGARLEIRASGNTNLAGPSIPGASLTQLRNGTLVSGNGGATTVTPNETNPFFIVIGPR